MNKITVTDPLIKEILFFDEMQLKTRCNILFGGNGSGKTTFLEAIKDGKVNIESDKEIIVKHFKNSNINGKTNTGIKAEKIKELNSLYTVNSVSEGQSVAHYVLTFLAELEDLDPEKECLILLDELDSGLSAENINMLLHEILGVQEKKPNT